MLEVKPQSQSDFFKVTERVYDKSSPFTSLLKSDLIRFLSNKNPLFSKYGQGEFFVCYKNGKPVGRITAHIHEKSNKLHNLKRGYFGFFDCENDFEVASKLLLSAETWCRSKGMTEIQGNFNLTAMQQVGVMTDGFSNPAYTDQVYSPPHIAEFLNKSGYKPYFPMSTFELDLTKFDPKQLLSEKVQNLLSNPEFEARNIKKKSFLKQIEEVRLILNDGFKDNPMFVPLTSEEFLFQAKDMMWIIDEDLSYTMYKNGNAIGTVVCIPNLNPFLKNTDSKIKLSTPYYYLKHKKQNKSAVIIFYSVHREFHGLGINPTLLYKMTTSLKDKGYETLGFTWIADVNKASLKQVEKLGGQQLHKLHLFKKEFA
ncbi:MAG: GNAT family N-acetyltransferase [Bdellovibrionales bacterium]|nr:GNAT family N-acetyltransferase [Bdellovibrionales bacterium]